MMVRPPFVTAACRVGAFCGRGRYLNRWRPDGKISAAWVPPQAGRPMMAVRPAGDLFKKGQPVRGSLIDRSGTKAMTAPIFASP
jgi:hypothetical protein